MVSPNVQLHTITLFLRRMRRNTVSNLQVHFVPFACQLWISTKTLIQKRFPTHHGPYPNYHGLCPRLFEFQLLLCSGSSLGGQFHGRKKTVWPYSRSPQKNHPKKKHISSNTCKPWSVKALRLHQDRPLVWSSHVFVFLSDDEDVKRKAGNEHPASVETFATPPLSRRGPPWTVPGPGGTLSCILRIACDKVEWSCIELKPFLFLYVYVSFAGL